MPAVKPAERTAKAKNLHYAKPTAANTCIHTICATCKFIQEHTHPEVVLNMYECDNKHSEKKTKQNIMQKLLVTVCRSH